MVDIGYFSKECVELGVAIRIFLRFPDKQEDFGALLPMVDISLACCRMIAGCALALPMERVGIDSIVVIQGCRREILV